MTGSRGLIFLRGRVTDALERALAERFGAEACTTFARGSTALYALFVRIAEALGEGEVIIPGICCEAVALAAIYAGMKPVIVDVSPENGCISPESVAMHLTPRTRAIVAVHLYGIAADLPALQAVVAGRDVALIEDLAHAAGGTDEHGRLLGTTFDYTLLSFADDKIIPGSGGALLCRSGAAFSVDDVRLPASRPDRVLRQYALSLRNLTHGLFDLAREDPGIDISGSFRQMIPYYRGLIVRSGPLPDARTVLSATAKLEATRRSRYDKYRQYREGIQNPHVKVVPIHEGAMVWRCPILSATANAGALTDLLRRNRVPASNHYFPLDKLLDDRAAPGNAAFGSRVINLWVDPATDGDAVTRAIDVINGFRPQ